MPPHKVGHARFLIGGDMDTRPHLLSGVLQIRRREGVLIVQENVFEP